VLDHRVKTHAPPIGVGSMPLSAQPFAMSGSWVMARAESLRPALEDAHCLLAEGRTLRHSTRVMTPKTVAIVQARTSSTRLPRKVLLDLEGQPLLAWNLRRLARASRIDEVVVATTTEPADAAIVELSAALGFRTWRGPLEDVLTRYVGAATMAEATTVVRVTSDCPFIDPQLLDETLSTWPRAGVDYLGFEGYPRGLDHEVMTMETLLRASADATLDYERVHVTPHVYRSLDKFRVEAIGQGNPLSPHRWCVDTPDDLAFVREVARRLGPGDTFGWEAIRDLVEGDAALMAMNAHVRQKAVEEG
jgi:spore coat polysaccharide biosynthesis protein SpsF